MTYRVVSTLFGAITSTMEALVAMTSALNKDVFFSSSRNIFAHGDLIDPFCFKKKKEEAWLSILAHQLYVVFRMSF